MVQRIKVISKKFDGSLRDEYTAYLYAETAEALVLFSPPTTLYYDYRRDSWDEAHDGLLEIHFKTRWYNVWHICDQNSYQNLMYCNVAMPATYVDGTLEWVDLDLDYRVHMDGRVELLDEDEFKQNTKAFGYSHEVVAQARAACHEVKAGIETLSFPFNHLEQVALYQRIRRRLLQNQLGKIGGASDHS